MKQFTCTARGDVVFWANWHASKSCGQVVTSISTSHTGFTYLPPTDVRKSKQKRKGA